MENIKSLRDEEVNYGHSTSEAGPTSMTMSKEQLSKRVYCISLHFGIKSNYNLIDLRKLIMKEHTTLIGPIHFILGGHADDDGREMAWAVVVWQKRDSFCKKIIIT